MKKLCVLLCALLTLSLTGCAKNQNLLVGKTWFCYDHRVEEFVTLKFNNDKTFIYEIDNDYGPVEDYGDFDTFEYDQKNNRVHLSGPKNAKRDIDIIYLDDDFLVVKFVYYTITFRNFDSKKFDTPDLLETMQLGYAFNLHTEAVKYKKDGMTVKNSRGKKVTFAVCDSIKFFIAEIDQNSDTLKYNYRKMNEKEIKRIGKTFKDVYISFDGSSAVDAMIFYIN